MIVSAFCYGSGCETLFMLMAWEELDYSITAVEFLPENSPHTTVRRYDSLDEFVENTDWSFFQYSEDLYDGIQNDELRNLVDEKHSTEEEGANDYDND